MLPFAKKLGYNLPDFDFAVEGVTSMSLDTHKYGYALKGSSVVLYRTKALRRSQYFSFPTWTGGIYTTPTIAGSRSGGIIAQTWASMMSMGMQGYSKHAQDIMETTQKIFKLVNEIKELKTLGACQAMIICFTGNKGVCIYAISEAMTTRGWALNTLQSPSCIHLCCTVCHLGKEEVFIRDLKDSVAEVMLQPINKKKVGKAAVYGMASSLPAGPINQLLQVYNDVILDV